MLQCMHMYVHIKFNLNLILAAEIIMKLCLYHDVIISVVDYDGCLFNCQII